MLRGFLDALGVPPAQIPADLDGAGRRCTAACWPRKRVLVVLDNAGTCAGAAAAAGFPGCLVVVTSRNRLAGLVASDGARMLTLDVLTAAEARELLRPPRGRPFGRAAAVDEIIARPGGCRWRWPSPPRGRPRIPVFPLAAIAAELRDAQGRLDALAEDAEPTSGRSSPGPIGSSARPPPDVPAARPAPGPGHRRRRPRPAWRPSSAAARALLAELARARLLTEHVPGRYACTTCCARTRPSWPRRRPRAPGGPPRRMLDHYLQTAHAVTAAPAAPATAPPPEPRPDATPAASPATRQRWPGSRPSTGCSLPR